MENQVNSKSIILKYGIILGSISLFISLTKHLSGNTYNTSDYLSGILSFVSTITLIILGIKRFKAENNDFLRWGQGVKTGLGIAIIAGIIGMIYQYIFMNFIEINFIHKSLELSIIKLQESGLNEEQIEAALVQAKKMTTPFFMFGISILGTAIGGFVISAIVSAILKKDERETF